MDLEHLGMFQSARHPECRADNINLWQLYSDGAGPSLLSTGIESTFTIKPRRKVALTANLSS